MNQSEVAPNARNSRKPADVGVLFFLPVILLLQCYRDTAAPGAWWGDGMELTCAANSLGIPHPTGYPLYVALGHLLIRLFSWVDPAWLMTYFSMMCCGLGAMAIGLSAWGWLRRTRGEAGASRTTGASCMGFALIVGFTRTLWEHASFPEVYPLTFLFVCLLVAKIVSANTDTGPVTARFWLPLAIIWGLAMLHHYSAMAILPLVVLAIGFRAGKFSPRPLAMFAGVSALFLFGYAFVLVRAGMNPELNWGDPSAWDRFITHISGGDYGALNQLRRQSAGGVISGTLFGIAWWGRQILPEANPGYAYSPSIASLLLGSIFLAGAIAGSVIIFKRTRVLAVGLILSLLITLAFSIIYIIPDRDGYFLPALPAMALGWVALLDAVALNFRHPTIRWNRIALVGTWAIAITLAMLQWKQVNKSDDRGPEIWAKYVLSVLPQNAVVITQPGNDSEIYALWYAQMVEGKRPDVTVFGGGFIFKGWYRKYFAHPSRPQVPLFITDRPPTDKATFDVALAAGVVMPNLASREVFFTYPETNSLIQLAPLDPNEASFGLPYAKYLQTGDTSYPFILPSGLLARATMNPESREIARREFAARFGLEPPR